MGSVCVKCVCVLCSRFGDMLNSVMLKCGLLSMLSFVLSVWFVCVLSIVMCSVFVCVVVCVFSVVVNLCSV